MSATARSVFGRYVRERRSKIAPQQTQAAERLSRRQVPGLRRQELADAAGISVEYLTRLEQGRATHPSREVLTTLGRALQLSGAQRDHLFRLAGELPPPPEAPAREVRPGLEHLLQSLGDVVPVTIHDGRLDALSRNAAAVELLGEIPDGGRYVRNIVYQGFTEPARRLLGPDGTEHYRRWATAELRSALGRYPDDERLRGVVDELSATSEAFRRHWARGDITADRSGLKQVLHPERGWLTFQSEMLHDEERDHWIVVYLTAA